MTSSRRELRATDPACAALLWQRASGSAVRHAAARLRLINLLSCSPASQPIPYTQSASRPLTNPSTHDARKQPEERDHGRLRRPGAVVLDPAAPCCESHSRSRPFPPPHSSSTPADTIEQKTNDPADLRQEPPQLGGGLNSNPEWAAFSAKGPYQPAAEVMQNVPAPATRDELKARSAELNK
jgi:hypothetical protein